jgi:hypothetical protein
LANVPAGLVFTRSLNGRGEVVFAANVNGVLQLVRATPIPDTTPPVVTPTVTGTLGTNGWYRSDVSVTWTATDAESAITSTPCLLTTVTVDTAGLVVSCTATSAGGTSTASVTIKRDKTLPSASITTPANGASYTQGQVVTASFACSDSLSGVAQCTGTVPNSTAIDTATAGPKTFTVTPTDLAGNVGAAAQVPYTIITPSLTLSVTPASLNFGTVRRFNLRTKSVTVKNTGTSAVSISTVSVTQGSGTYDFTSLSVCPSSLTAGKSCTIYVLLFAYDRGPSLSATLNIPNNVTGSTQSVPLSATVN